MNEVVIMPDQEKRSIDEIMEDLQRINQEFRESVRDGFKNPDDFIKLSEIEKMRAVFKYSEIIFGRNNFIA